MASKKNRRGRFITLEGGEGAGKSTQARRIADYLRARGQQVVLTREPGGSPVAEKIRAAVLSDEAGNLSAKTETVLMFAARAAHLEQTILPALNAGQDVVCDRFADSSYAYQGAGKGVAKSYIQALEKMVVGRLKPDLTLLLDLPPELGLRRARQRGEQNRFEAETLAFMRRVRRAFLQRAKAEPRRYAVIDGDQPLEAVSAQILAALEQRL